MAKIKDKSKKIKVLGAKVYAAVLLVLLVAFFNPFTAVMVALFFMVCFLFGRALTEVKWRAIFFEEDKE